MREPTNRRRIGITMLGRSDDRGQVREVPKGRRHIPPEQIVLVTEDMRGTCLRRDGEQGDIATAERLDELVAASNGELIIVTPVGFADDPAPIDHDKRGTRLAVNPDHLTVLPDEDVRGTVIRIDTAPREIVVSETAEQIEALIDG